jgi:hypothetical protein
MGLDDWDKSASFCNDAFPRRSEWDSHHLPVASTVTRSSVGKMNSGSEDADEKTRDEDAHDQPEGAEWNPAFATDRKSKRTSRGPER